ncbi:MULTISPECIES: ABC transporter ATP-binding protein [Pseudoalteromonas]|uniref:ABC transporter ATP-binding protein n=1 Tax=Pseudoalteromonas TaxID=53246 RepID=UPI0002FA1CCE|nr:MULTISPECIES: ABC transporter ATP-binding protein [Pseudoalteromonas]MCF6144769.1 iron complex transport system ATP-binding protein [Pseudoalteromonas mariniglutinosa NCIMB 1770]
MHTPDAAPPPLLKVTNLSWSVASTTILQSIDFSIKAGQFIGLLGPNGAGKSSLLRCLYRYSKPGSGEVAFAGQNIWQLSADEYAKQVAVVLQETPSQFNLSLYDVVSLGLTPHKSLFSSTTTTDKELILQAIEQVGLSHHCQQSFDSLSGGEKQRALIARSIVQGPKLLIMDEPTSHLDIKYQIQLMELAKSLNVTVLASFHDLNLAASMCDELLVLKKGRLVASGTPEQVITEKMLSDVFGVCAEVSLHPQSEQLDKVIPHITYFYGYQTGVTNGK